MNEIIEQIARIDAWDAGELLLTCHAKMMGAENSVNPVTSISIFWNAIFYTKSKHRRETTFVNNINAAGNFIY